MITSGAIMILTGAATRPALAIATLESHASTEFSTSIATRAAGGSPLAKSPLATRLMRPLAWA